MIKLICQVCGKEYFRHPYAAPKSKHCSRQCHNKIAGQASSKPWAHKISKGSMGKKCPWLTERNLTNNPAKKGKEHFFWKGDKVGYIAIHNWAHRHVGLRDSCEQCGSILRLEMSNKSGQYKRELEDWQTLCKKCHIWFDINFRKNGGITKKLHKWKKKNPA